MTRNFKSALYKTSECLEAYVFIDPGKFVNVNNAYQKFEGKKLLNSIEFESFKDHKWLLEGFVKKLGKDLESIPVVLLGGCSFCKLPFSKKEFVEKKFKEYFSFKEIKGF